MPLATAANLLGSLRQVGLLDAARLEELARRLAGENLDPRSLGKKLIQHGCLTAYQVNQLLQGRGADLVLGQYVLLERLGEGSNGQVFKARHRAMQRDVAIKVLRRELLSDAEIVGRFHREIEVVSQIAHPNIVHAYDAGPIGSHLVLAMEFIEGIDFERLVRQSGPLSVPEAVDFIQQAAHGLQHAHERGLVHRDIKPANLIVAQPKSASAGQRSTVRLAVTLDDRAASPNAPFGVVKILDLGLARLQEAAPDSRSANLTLLAGQSVMQGTPDYMAPEQALDFHTADIRSDIYSLGCTLFFLLTGRPPFAGMSLAEKLMKHQQAEPPSVQAARPEVPEALARVVARMLAKRPEDRFQTPGEVAKALAGLRVRGAGGSQGKRRGIWSSLAGRPWAAASVVPRLAWRTARRRPRRALVAAGLLAALVLGVLFVRQWAADGLGSKEQAALRQLLGALDNPEMGAPETLERLGKFLRANPEQQGLLREELLAVRTRQPGSPQAVQAGVWLTYLPSPLDQLSAGQIPEKKRFAGQPPELVAVLGDIGPNYYRVNALAFRPDCRMLAVSTGPPEIALWDVSGSAPQRLPNLRGHGQPVASLAFTPDSKMLVSGGGNNSSTGDNTIRLWDVAQAESKSVAVLAGHTNTVNTMAISPDGKSLASSGQDQTVRLWDLGQREGRLLAEKTTFVNSLAFAPDGKTLAIGGSYWPHVRLQEMVPAPAGKHRDLPYGADQHSTKVAFSPDGTIVVAAVNGQLVFWDAHSHTEQARLKGQAFGARDLVFLPDGRSFLSGEASDENQSNVSEPPGQVVLWASQSREPNHTWRFPCGGVRQLALATDGRHLAVGGRNSLVYILRLAPPKFGP